MLIVLGLIPADHPALAETCEFLEIDLGKYYGNEKEGLNIDDPLHTVTSRDLFGLVTVEGVDY